MVVATDDGSMTDDFALGDTIAALASAPGPALRGIVRVSGPQVREIVEGLFTPNDKTTWDRCSVPWRHSGFVTLSGVHSRLPVDVLDWRTRRSYTGEPMVEFHTLGCPPLLEALQQNLFAQGARPARRGEFTLRAFLAGRIDLVQAEAVLGVIDATDEAQLQLALSQLGGGLSGRIAHIHEELLLQLADLEAGLDFVEEDIEFITRREIVARIDTALEFLARLLEQSSGRMLASSRFRVVLAGLPNAGKSTLFNALVGDSAALVSDIAGTTRDYLTARLYLDGLEIELIDTAGFEEGTKGVGHAANEQRQRQWSQADLLLWCTAADLSEHERSLESSLRGEASDVASDALHILTKGDLAPRREMGADVVVSPVTGLGMSELRAAIRQKLQTDAPTRELLGSTAARCHESLRGAVDGLQAARHAALDDEGDELIALELRSAVDALGRIVGRIWTDDILDRIFSRFCIGK